MNRLDKRTRLNQRFAWFAVLALFLGLFAAGCGSDGGGSVGQAPQPPLPTIGNVLVHFDLEGGALARQVPAQVVDFRVTGYNANGVRIYGPLTRSRSSQELFTEVSTLVASFRVEYLLANGTPSGLSAFPVTVLGGQTSVYTAQYEDFTNPTSLTGITMSPATGQPLANLPAGLQQNFTARADFLNGQFVQFISEDALWASSETEFATVPAEGTQGGAIVTAVSQGQTVISATYAGKVGKTTLNATAAELTALVVTPPAPSIPKGMTQQFTATGTFTDGTQRDVTGQVAWTSSAPAVAAINATGLATGLTAGTTQIRSSLTYTPHFGQGPVTVTSPAVTLTVTNAIPVSISVEPVSPTLVLGLTQAFQATVTWSDNTTTNVTNTATWLSSNVDVASFADPINMPGVLQSHKLGQTDVTAEFTAEGRTVVSPIVKVAVVDAMLESIVVTPADAQVAAGLTQQYTAMGQFSDGNQRDITPMVNWTSETPAVATVSSDPNTKGLVTTLTQGTSVIRATSVAIPNHPAVTGAATLTVLAKVPVAVQVTPSALSTPNGLNAQFAAQVVFSDGSSEPATDLVTWACADATIAVPTGVAGQFLGQKVGTTEVTATLGALVSPAAHLTVTDAVLRAVVVTPDAAQVAAGLEQQFKAMGTFTDGTEVDLTEALTWASSVQDVATISNEPNSKGLASTRMEGATDISAATPAGFPTETGAPIITTVPLVVNAATLQSITIDRTNLTMDPDVPLGTLVQFRAMGHYSDKTEVDITAQVAWTSSDPAVATIDVATGLATTLAAGQTTIRAELGAVNSEVSLTVSNVALVSIAVTPADARELVGTTPQYTATGTYSDGVTQDITGQVAWTSSDAAVATIGGNTGLATAVAPGVTVIQARDSQSGITGQTNLNVVDVQSLQVLYNAEVTTDLNVPQYVNLPFGVRVTYSDGFQVDNPAHEPLPGLDLQWTSSHPSVVFDNPINPAAYVNGVPGDVAVVTVTSDRTGVGGNVHTGTCNVTVNNRIPNFVEVRAGAPLGAIGETSQYTAWANFEGDFWEVTRQATWTSNNAAVATVVAAGAQAGLVTLQGGGTALIGATAGGFPAGQLSVTFDAPTLLTIAVTPNPTTVTVGDPPLQMVATGSFSDGIDRPVTDIATWTLQDQTAGVDATISNIAGTRGQLSAGTTAGNANVLATVGAIISPLVPLTINP